MENASKALVYGLYSQFTGLYPNHCMVDAVDQNQIYYISYLALAKQCKNVITNIIYFALIIIFDWTMPT